MIGSSNCRVQRHLGAIFSFRTGWLAIVALTGVGFASAVEVPAEPGAAALLVAGRRLARNETGDGGEEATTNTPPLASQLELGSDLDLKCDDLKCDLAVALNDSQLTPTAVQLSSNKNGVLPWPAVGDEPVDVAPDFAARLDELESKYADLEKAHDSLKDSLSDYVRSGHDATKMKLNGRVHFDMWQFPESSPGINGFESGDLDTSPQDQIGFRRLRFGVNGDVWHNMLYRIEAEFAGGNDIEFRDAYLGFTDLPWLQTVLIGNQKRPYGLDHWNSSRYNVFLERPFAIEGFNQDSRRLGIQSWSHSEDLAWNWQHGVFNQRLVQDEGNYTSDHWQMQYAGRVANTIWYDECSDGRGYAHWAVSGTVADTDGDAATENFADSGINEARFRTRPEARSTERWLDTGLINGADQYTLVGLENVINVGPTQLVGEYQHVWLDREPASQLQFHGAYAYLSYFLTGEHMPWNRETGQLDRIKPFENFFVVDTCDDGVRSGWGAWQVAARWSYADFADDDIQGGIGQSFTFGLNWYWNPWARMQFNYIYGDIHDNELNAVGGVDFGHYQILGTRFMIDF